VPLNFNEIALGVDRFCMRTNKLILVILILVPLAVFWQTRSFDFVWDDEINVQNNPYFYPVTLENTLSFWKQPYERLYIPISYTVWAAIAALEDGQKPDPSLFHVANVFFHVLSTLVLFAVLNKVIKSQWACCGGALMFALHPIQVEPVAWITGMKDLLSGLLSLVALWQFLSYSSAKNSLTSPRQDAKNKSQKAITTSASLGRKACAHYTLATIAFVLALLAKPTAVVTPLIALCLNWWALRKPSKEIAAALVLWLLMTIPFIIATKVVQPETNLDFVTPLWARPLVAADALAFYLFKLFWPLWLAPDYGRLPELVIERGWIYFTGFVPCLLSLLVFLVHKKRPWLVAAAGIFAVGILPVSGLLPFSFQNTSTVADRYLYLSMLGPALAVAWFLSERREQVILACGGVTLVLLGIMSFAQARHWQNDSALFSHALKHNPVSWTAHYSLARALVKQGKNAEAITLFREAVRLKPEFTNAHFSLGSLLTVEGNLAEAIAEYSRALKIAPNFVDARFGLGNALALRGDHDAAIAEYRRALAINPRRVDIHFSLGNLLALNERLTEAAQSLKQAIQIRPDFALAHNSLGRVLAAQGDLIQATNHFRDAVRIDPAYAEAHESLALALAQQRKTEEAERHLRQAWQLKAARAKRRQSN